MNRVIKILIIILLLVLISNFSTLTYFKIYPEKPDMSRRQNTLLGRVFYPFLYRVWDVTLSYEDIQGAIQHFNYRRFSFGRIRTLWLG